MSIINFIICFTIVIYVLGYIIYGFYDKMTKQMPSLENLREFFTNLRTFLDYIGYIPMYFGQFVAWLLVKLNDFFNFVCNLFKKKK